MALVGDTVSLALTSGTAPQFEHMKIRGFRAESVFAVPTRIPDFDIEGAAWARGPHAAVLYAKRA